MGPGYRGPSGAHCTLVQGSWALGSWVREVHGLLAAAATAATAAELMDATLSQVLESGRDGWCVGWLVLGWLE